MFDENRQALCNSWHSCVQWLDRCLPEFRDTFQEASTNREEIPGRTLQVLQDGLVLCHLLPVLSKNKLSLEKLRNFHQCPSGSKFASSTNINIFLTQCVHYFDLDSDILFSADDLLFTEDCEKLSKILFTLSALSNCVKASKSGISGFKVEKSQLYDNLEYYMVVEEQENNYYMTPKEKSDTQAMEHQTYLITQESSQKQSGERHSYLATKDFPDQTSLDRQSYMVPKDATEEQPQKSTTAAAYDAVDYNSSARYSLYEQPLAYTKKPDVVALRVQKSREKAYTVLMEPEKLLMRKSNCLSEFIESETKLVRLMQKVISVKENLQTLETSWSPQQIDTVFKYFIQLTEIHSEILNRIKTAYDCDNYGEFAQVFIDLKSKMCIYANYSFHLNTAKKELEIVYDQNGRRLAELKKILEIVFQNPETKISDYITIPMQHLLKYPLLFDSLIKYSSADVKLVQTLQKAQSTTVDLNQFVNEFCRDKEMIAMLRQIETGIPNMKLPPNVSMTDYGRLLIDGDILLYPNAPSKQKNQDMAFEKVFCFLLERLLIVCSIEGKMEQTKFHSFYVIKTESEISLETFQIKQKQNSKLWSFGFTIGDLVSSPFGGMNQFTMIAKNQEQCEKWKEAFKTAMNNFHPSVRNQKSFLKKGVRYCSCEVGDKCQLCDNLLHGAFYQCYELETSPRMKLHKNCLLFVLEHDHFIAAENHEPRIISSTADIRDQPLTFKMNDLVWIESTTSIYSTGKMLGGKQGIFPTKYFQKWYVGEMNRDDAKDSLADKQRGGFVVRINPENKHVAISVKYTHGVKAFMIYNINNKWYLCKEATFNSLVDLVEYYTSNELPDKLDSNAAIKLKL